MNTPALRKQAVWQGTHRDINFKIVNWKFETKIPEYSFKENWNYYVYIPEKRSPRFSEIWLPDIIKEVSPYVTHDYYTQSIGSVEMHGGITYYAKHGHVEGFRVVEIGCDYQHYWDEGERYNEEYITRDAMRTIDDLYEKGIIGTDV